MAEAEYVARLVAHLTGRPRVNLAQLGHNVVPKPDGVQPLGQVLRQHPSIFRLHQVGAADAVSLVPDAAAPPQPSRQPARPTGQNAARTAARSSGVVDQAAKLFWQLLTNDPDLRARCTNRRALSEEFRAWKARQPQAVAGVAPSEVINKLRRQGLIEFTGSDTINFATSRAAAAAKKLTENREQVESDKGSVTVSRVNFGTVRLGESVTQRLYVRNEGAEPCWVRSAMLERGNTGFTATLAQNVPFPLQPGMETSVAIRARPAASGMARDLFTLGFESDSGRFTIGRFLEVRCGDVDLLSDLKPETPYSKPKRRARRTDGETLEEFYPPAEEGGGGPAATGPKLELYRIPKMWKAALEQEELTEAVETLVEGQQVLEEASQEAAMAAHAAHFHLLLWAEERQLNLDLHNFDLVTNTTYKTLTPNPNPNPNLFSCLGCSTEIRTQTSTLAATVTVTVTLTRSMTRPPCCSCEARSTSYTCAVWPRSDRRCCAATKCAPTCQATAAACGSAALVRSRWKTCTCASPGRSRT